MERIKEIEGRLSKIDKNMKVFKCSYEEQDSACGIYEGDYLDCSHDECHHPLSIELAEYIVHSPSDIEYLLAENKRLREYLIQIEDESSHEDGCLTQVNGMAREALEQE